MVQELGILDLVTAWLHISMTGTVPAFTETKNVIILCLPVRVSP